MVYQSGFVAKHFTDPGITYGTGGDMIPQILKRVFLTGHSTWVLEDVSEVLPAALHRLDPKFMVFEVQSVIVSGLM